jgi:twitching motility protein PilU
MEKSENVGMQTFDSHLMRLFKDGIISLEDALHNSDSPNNLKLKINLSEGLGSLTEDLSKLEGEGASGGLSLQAIETEEDEAPENDTGVMLQMSAKPLIKK